ncbi:MAG: hypothetical protein MUD10_04425 [Candidatus Pacebacteria bacterium]|nr:hypothetical protein [Candidatus Paceibacterota bacterium]
MFTSSGDSHGKISQTSSVKIHLEGASGNGTIFATNEKSTPNSYDRTELNGTVRYSNTTPLSFNMSSALDYGNEISVKESTTNDWNSLIPGSPLPPAANATIPTNISNSEDKVPPKKMPDVGTIGGICAFALIFIARRR